VLAKEEGRTFDGTESTVKAKTATISIPRCARCRYVHRVRKIVPWASAPIPLIIFFGTLLVSRGILAKAQTSSNAAAGGMVLGLGVLSMVCYFLGQLFLRRLITPDGKEIKHEDMVQFEYPLAKALKARGWKTYL
jgi:hypothetical protein